MGIFTLLFLLLCLPVSIRLVANRTAVVSLRVGGIPLYRYPKAKKRIRPRHYTRRAMAKRKRQEARKAQKKAARLEKKEAKRAKKNKKPTSPQSKPKKKTHEITHWLHFLQRVISILLTHFHRHLRLKFCRLHIKVATTDAASTAILYGAVCAAATCLLETLSHAVRVKCATGGDDVSVTADYLADHTQVDAEIRFSMSLGWLLLCALRLFFVYLKNL